jgi:hypothetical protein
MEVTAKWRAGITHRPKKGHKFLRGEQAMDIQVPDQNKSIRPIEAANPQTIAHTSMFELVAGNARQTTRRGEGALNLRRLPVNQEMGPFGGHQGAAQRLGKTRFVFWIPHDKQTPARSAMTSYRMRR